MIYQPGNDPSKRSRRPAATATTNGKAPSCPRWLHQDAKTEWQRIVPLLQSAGRCGLEYRATIAAYCQAYARWKQAEQRIDAEGLTVKTPNGMLIQAPWVAAADRSFRKMMAVISLLGLSPADRSRVADHGAGEQGLSEYERYRLSKPSSADKT